MDEPAPRLTRLVKSTDAALAEAAAALRAGGLVAMPTETVYGLAGLATLDAAVAAIYAAKGRPSFNPLIAHIADIYAARAEVEFDAQAERLAEAFWPGPLTIVAPAPEDKRLAASERRARHARSAHARARGRARADRARSARRWSRPRPIAAGASARPPPRMCSRTSTDASISSSTRGRCRHGLESTIVACLGGSVRLLRPGALERERIEEALGERLEIGAEGAAPVAPGMLASHYAPRARLRLEATDAGPEEAALDFAGRLADSHAKLRLDLSPGGDLTEAAANLFAHLRRLDASGASSIAAAPVPRHGLGAAINDRLARAAAPREG